MENILLVTGGTVKKEFLRSVLVSEEVTYIIGVDKGLEVLEEAGISPDLSVGDFDSANERVREKYADLANTLRLSPEKDYTDTHAALFQAIERKPDKIVILGGTGTRLDHTLGNLGLLIFCVKRGIRAFLLDENNKIQMIDKKLLIKKKEQYGRYVSCIPYSDHVKGITLKGFLYSMEEGTMRKGETIGISNEIREEEGLITIKEGYLFVMETKD